MSSIVIPVHIALVATTINFHPFLLGLFLLVSQRPRQTNLQRQLTKHLSILLFHRLDSIFPLVKVNESVVLHLSDALQLTILLKHLLNLFLCDFCAKILDIEHLDLGHGLLIWLVIWVCPVNSDFAVEHSVESGRAELSLGYRR